MANAAQRLYLASLAKADFDANGYNSRISHITQVDAVVANTLAALRVRAGRAPHAVVAAYCQQVRDMQPQAIPAKYRQPLPTAGKPCNCGKPKATHSTDLHR